MTDLRQNHDGLIWTGVESNEPSGRRVVPEVTFELADQILNLLAEEAGQAWAPEDLDGPFAKAVKEVPAEVLDGLIVTVGRE